MTAEEAKAKLEAWAELLKAKLEGVHSGPWEVDENRPLNEKEFREGARDPQNWMIYSEKFPDTTGKTGTGIVSYEKHTWIYLSGPEADIRLMGLSRAAVSAMLAGIEAVLNAGVKDQADLPVMEDRSVVVYPRAGKILRAAITVAEASILIAMAKAYEPYFQEVQS